jgi:hypothetical protein
LKGNSFAGPVQKSLALLERIETKTVSKTVIVAKAMYTESDDTFYGVSRAEDRYQKEFGGGSIQEVEQRLKNSGWHSYDSNRLTEEQRVEWPGVKGDVSFTLWRNSSYQYLAVWEENVSK